VLLYNRLPFGERCLNLGETVVRGALTQKGNPLAFLDTILDDVMEALIRFAESQLVVLSARRAGSHQVRLSLPVLLQL